MRKARSAAAFSALSLMLLAGQAAPIFAEPTNPDTPPVTEPVEPTPENVTVTIGTPGENLTYAAYQLFTGSFNADPRPTDKDGNPVAKTEFENVLEGKTNQGASGLRFGDAEFGSATKADNGAKLIDIINEYMKGKEGWTKKEQDSKTHKINKDLATSAAQQIVDLIAETSDLRTADFANYLKEELKKDSNLTTIAPKDEVKKVDGKDVRTVEFSLEKGYYLIVSNPKTGVTPEKNLAHTSAMLLPVNAALTIESKSSLPTIDKQVKDHTNNQWGDTASVGLINSDGKGNYTVNGVSYKLIGSVAKNISDYEKYKYRFVDKLPEGMVIGKKEDGTNDFDHWSFKYTVSGKSKANPTQTVTKELVTKVTDSNTQIVYPLQPTVPDPESTSGASTLTWSFDDLKTLLDAAGIDYSYENAQAVEVVIEYTPHYTQTQIEAIWAANQDLAKPQENTAYIEFSNDPKGEGEGKTKEDDTRVYSFNLEFTKKGEGADKDLLKGAKFDLYEGEKLVAKDLDPTDNGKFKFTGLDAGIVYTLKETKRPDGYKAIEDIQFKIIAHEGVDPTTNKKVIDKITLEFVNNPGGAFTPSKESNVDENGQELGTFTFEAATINGSVQNFKGPNMPVTGQAGIWTGVAVGGLVLAVSAVAILKNKKEEA